MSKKHNLVLLLLLMGVYLKAQTLHVKGFVLGVNESPIADVNITLCDKADSTLIIKATITDVKGRFTLSKIPHGNYNLFASSVGYNKTIIRIDNLRDDINDLRIVMNEELVNLEEITISAQRIVTEFDRQIIYPSQFEKENAMDGVELVSKMRLHGIIVDQMTNSIKGIMGGVVKLRINGAPADWDDVHGIDPKLVTHVEYHDLPSVRYGDAESVIDFYVKRRETGGTAKLFSNNSVTTKNGNETGSLKVNHRKSEFFLSGGLSYYSSDKNYDNQTTRYNFENGKTLLRKDEGLPSKYNENIYNGAFNYSYYDPGNLMFATKLSYSFYATPNRGGGEGRIYEGEEPVIHRQSSYYIRDKKPRYSLYYHKNLKNKQLIVFELMGTYIYTDSHRLYEETQEEKMITDILSDADGDTYYIVAEGLYEKRFAKSAKLITGLKQGINLADINYTGSTNYKSRIDGYSTTAYAEWAAKIGKFDYSGALNGIFNRTIQKAGNNTHINFSPAIKLGYRFARGIQLRYSSSISMSLPQLKNLNNVDQAVNGYETRRGNPDLGTITNYSNSLFFTYSSGNLMTTLNVNDSHTVHPILNSVFRENDKFITKVQNGKSQHNTNVQVSGDWSAFGRRLNIFGRVIYTYAKNVAADYSHSLHSCHYNIGISWTHKDFTLRGSANKDRNSLSNESIRYGGQGVNLGLDYKWKNLKLGGDVNWRTGHSYSSRIKSLNRFVSSDRYSYIPVNPLFRLKLSWNIKFGRQREDTYQRIENIGGEGAVF